MKIKIPYLIVRDWNQGARYYWQPSTKLRRAGWGPIDYQKPVATIEGERLLTTETEIFNHARARNAEIKGASPRNVPSAASLASWIDEFELDGRYFSGLSDASKRQYRLNFTLIKEWAGDRPPGSIRKADVLNLFDALEAGRGLRTAGAVITSLKRLYNWAEAREKSSGMVNPAAGLKLETPKARNERWEDREIAALIALADVGTDWLDPDPDFGTAVAIAYYLGLRQGDMLRLRPADNITVKGSVDGTIIERAGMLVETSKTGATVAVPYHKVLAERLEGLGREPMMPYVLTKAGGVYQARWFSRQVEKWRAALAMQPGFEQVADKTWHDLRRSTVVKLAEIGLDTPVIRAVTGHSLKSIETMLEVYLVRSQSLTLRAITTWEAQG